MSKHEWKPGDKCLVETEVAESGSDRDGDIMVHLTTSYGFARAYTQYSHLHPLPPDHSDWIGKPASELPEGTVFDAKSNGRHGVLQRMIWMDGSVQAVDEQDRPITPWMPADAPVIRIHKLGEQRPKTLADVPKWDAWEGDALGTAYYHDGCGQVYMLGRNQPSGVKQDGFEPQEISLEGKTRLGPIEGVKIGGKMYGEGE